LLSRFLIEELLFVAVQQALAFAAQQTNPLCPSISPQDLFFHPCVDRFLTHPLVPSLEKRCVFLRKWKRVCVAEEVKKMCLFLRKK
jgi:hypothetical protein